MQIMFDGSDKKLVMQLLDNALYDPVMSTQCEADLAIRSAVKRMKVADTGIISLLYLPKKTDNGVRRPVVEIEVSVNGQAVLHEPELFDMDAVFPAAHCY